MGLWAYLIIRGFAPSVFRHLQLPINPTYIMGLLACLPSFLCTFGMVAKKRWSLPLSIFFFLYTAVIFISFVRWRGVIQVCAYGSYFDLAVYFVLVAISGFLACVFAFDNRIKQFFRYQGVIDFLNYLFQYRKLLILLTIWAKLIPEYFMSSKMKMIV